MAASLLGDTPTGQVDNIDKMMEKGLINDPADLAEEMLSPDVQTFLALQSSPKRVIQMAVGQMLSGGEYVSPEPQDNLALAAETANKMYQHARTQKCPRREDAAAHNRWNRSARPAPRSDDVRSARWRNAATVRSPDVKGLPCLLNQLPSQLK